jgi:spore maturation protein CgeB
MIRIQAEDQSLFAGEMPERLLIVGGVGGTNVGESLYRAAQKMGIQARILDTRRAFDAPAWLRAINWRLLGRRPAHLRAFGRELLDACTSFRPQVLITTGLAPVSRHVLERVGRLNIRTLNFLTDDPWNPAHRARWFMRALPAYDYVYSPRRAMLADLENTGCKQVRFLPFGYDEDLFFTPEEASGTRASKQTADVMFAGGADVDRVPYMQAFIENGFDLALYGDYWHRQAATKNVAKGQADVATLRLAIASAKVALCLVRRANRDGSCMRTFEVPAVGACMLTEDTPEHRVIFGEEGEAVLYFDSQETMLEKARALCDNEALRTGLAQRAHQLITTGGHTYRHRLAAMLAGKGWASNAH